jgi:hypothetical protein
MKTALVFAAIGEAATGLAFLIVPSLVVHLLLGQDLAGRRRPCGARRWHRPLAYLGLGGLSGLLLWPAVVLHAILSVILGRVVVVGDQT